MIETLNLIRNIGRFDSVSTGAQLPFGKFTLIYGENGRGKTTISAILKSLSNNDSSLIEERHRLGATHRPHVVVQVAGVQYVFQNGSWSTSVPQILVFDDGFVTQNVCSGIEVSTNHHCRNLHELILGSQGVALNNQFQAHVTRIEQHTSELRTRSAVIPANVRGGFTVEQFCALDPVENIDEAIQEAERRLSAAKSVDEIRQKEIFQVVRLPLFDIEAINVLLASDLLGIEADAVLRVQNHLENTGSKSEKWIADGLPYIATLKENTGQDSCPFCAQDLTDSTIITHYQAYFSDAYNNLRRSVEDMGKAINATHGGNIPAAFERSISKIIEARNFWSKFTEIPEVNIDTAQFVRALNDVRDKVRQTLLAKYAAPLEKMGLDQDAINAIEIYHTLKQAVDDILSSIEGVNPQITLVKEQAASADVASLTNDLVHLKRVKTRYTEPIVGYCQNYLQEVAAKQVTEQARDTARAALDNYQQNIFPQYETSINNYLARFNAGYRLGNVTSRNTRWGASCDYKVLINNQPVSLSSSNGPSFKNTLSAGDRNTLALAFFFASLEHEPTLAQTIVVIDDPMTSLDEHRSLTTRQQILSLIDRTAQVVVCSHEKHFLCGLWEARDRINRVAMMIERDGDGSTISEWDVTRDCVTEHDHRHELIRNFLQRGSRVEERRVATALRPILEAFCRVAYPADFPPGSMLGHFCDTCRNRIGQSNEILSQQDTQELRQILDYANRFHHDTNTAYETEGINDGELRLFAERTLNFTKRS